MRIDGPNGPGGLPPSDTTVKNERIHATEGVSEPSDVAETHDAKGIQDAGGVAKTQSRDFDAMLDEAARIVPPDMREEFKDMVREMSATDPVLQSMLRRLGREEK